MAKDETEAEFTERKKRLLLTLLRYRFEDTMMDILESTNYESMEELDADIDEKLRQYDEQTIMVREYYDELIVKKEKENG